ncbi:DUF1737 domain-containing protein [Kiloniella laminariae]|uniref:DUF1737 domain-containing protein n=1 Tax=Kiloniella laminariae TaxID=454162 RepID=A0ABT4LJC6_9PROT|nr:DUF1737 domain-containing protein [Kiloniella laminariae]MCZ4281203.1 DUF1737 domain-containing protein [Kiloniella laminariae]
MKQRYRFITGKDDDQFCKRVSQALNDGYHLYGSPSLTFNGTEVICGQAVVWPTGDKNSDTKTA